MFDGNIEVPLSNDGRTVIAHTNKYVNYEFWSCLKENPARVAEIADHFDKIDDKNIFYILQQTWPTYADPYVRSAYYFLLNKYSDSGYISHGEFTPENYNPVALVNLKRLPLQNLHVQLDQQEDFIDSMNRIDTLCDYIFLPIGRYSLNLLEEGRPEGFEETKVYHKKVKQFFDSTDKRTVLLYRATPAVIKLYKESNMYFVDKWGREIDNQKDASEVLIANF
tara:strand:- start:678 stop:1346 length:669 start_codon:yes stop_codon:yes gene_type:complete